MCIIISKEKNARLPKEEELKTSFEYNRDGAGFMYVENGQVIIDKGYMTYDEFISHYRKLLKRFNNFKNKSLVIHCRIGTSGGNTKANTHPYPITDNASLLHNTKVITDIGIAHNGIIHGYGELKGLSDTQEFIMKYITPLYDNYKNFYKNEEIMKGIQKITNSKFAILDDKDDIYYIGDFVEDEGLKFSNTTYKSYRYSYSNDYSYNKTYSYSYKRDEDEDAKFSLNNDTKKLLDVKEVDNILDMVEDDYVPSKDEYLMEVNSNYYIDLRGDGNDFERVGDRKLWFDWATYYLYEENALGELKLISDNPMIWDEEFVEVI